MFLDSCLIIPSAWMITIWSLVLVVRNLIGESVSSAILLMTFEDISMEAIHACVFFIMLSGLRNSRRVLAHLSLMMLPSDTMKASNVSTRTELIW